MKSRLAFCAAAVPAALSIIATGLDDDGGAVLVFVAIIFALGALGRPSSASAVLQVALGGLFLVAISAGVGLENWILLAAFANSAISIGRRFLGRVPNPHLS